MRTVVDELNVQLSEFELCHIAYRVYPSEGLVNCKDAYKKAHLQMRKYPFFTTNSSHREFITRFFMLQSVMQVQFYHYMLSGRWPENFVKGLYGKGPQDFIDAKKELFEAYGIHSETSLFVHRQEDKFVGHFVIHSPLSSEELDEFLRQRFAKKTLELTHFYLTRNFPSLINPYINNGKIKKRTLNVLEQISRGANRQEAADNLFMSSRGIDYHLEVFRKEFHAKNNYELVRLVKESCIL